MINDASRLKVGRNVSSTISAKTSVGRFHFTHHQLRLPARIVTRNHLCQQASDHEMQRVLCIHITWRLDRMSRLAALPNLPDHFAVQTDFVAKVITDRSDVDASFATDFANRGPLESAFSKHGTGGIDQPLFSIIFTPRCCRIGSSRYRLIEARRSGPCSLERHRPKARVQNPKISLTATRGINMGKLGVVKQLF